MDSTSLEAHQQDAFLDELPDRLARGLAHASGKRFVSLTLLARDFPGSPALPASGPAVWWGRSGEHHFRVGVGSAWETESEGNDRFRILASAHRRLIADWHAGSLDGSVPLRGAFLGFAFSPDSHGEALPNALLSVPRVIAERRGSTTLMHFNGRCDEPPEELVATWARTARELFAAASPDTLGMAPPPRTAPPAKLSMEDAEWAARVRHALAAIQSPPLEKLVLTRRVDLELAKCPNLGHILEWLAAEIGRASCRERVSSPV